ncbi:MAG: plasmid pRiA4b ORF-3 family protein [Euryarchaeota archaeon]|nr:plasmid pRiA4b ORF-3 family protein [Euryarchaeota archaeon]
MKKNIKNVYQFKISLQETKPLIWRRIQVPEKYTFWDLHVAIQDAMGWNDYHLHEFNIKKPGLSNEVSIGIPEEDLDTEFLPGWKHKIADYFSMDNQTAEYIYDFGDDWAHTIKLEKIFPLEKKVKYPLCIKGKRACPPEDVGGVYGYEEFLRIMQNPKHKEHKSMLNWIGGKFDPEKFDVNKIHFDNPDRHLKMMRD